MNNHAFILQAKARSESQSIAFYGEMLLDRNLYGKQLMYEQSARVPLIVRWPERFGRGVKSEALVSSLDLVATLLDVAGTEMPVVHGQSLAPLLESSTQSHKNAVCLRMGPGEDGARGAVEICLSSRPGNSAAF